MPMDPGPKPRVILDTCVLIDMVLDSRPRHRDARRLGEYLVGNKVWLRLPATALFEVAAAAHSERRAGAAGSFVFPPAGQPFEVDLVAIDQAFIERYLDLTLPYVKAGDLIFLAMAKRDGDALVTEDAGLYAKAGEAGVSVFTIAEFLDAL